MSPVLETVTLVLAAAQAFASEALLWTSVKAALAAGASGDAPRFRRVRCGVYERVR